MSWQGSLCHDMEVFVMTWKSMSWHRPTIPDHPGLFHDMEVYVTTWKSLSWHGSLCHDMEVYVMTWKSMSRYGSLCHDMEVFVMTWKSLSWHRPISSKSDIQKSPITKKCMVVKGLRNPIEWPYKLTKIDESCFVGSSITPYKEYIHYTLSDYLRTLAYENSRAIWLLKG